MEKQNKCTKCNANLEDGMERCKHCDQNSNVVVETENKINQVNKVNKKKPFNKAFLLYGSVAIAIIVIITSILLFNSSSTSEKIVYIRDGELHALSMKNQKPIQLSEEINKQTEYISESHILKSEDGRYIFYPDSMSDYNDSTYYWMDLSKDNSQSQSSIRVDSEVHGDNYLTKEGSKFFYIKGSENRLYLYDRKTGEKSKLDDEVEAFYVNESGDYLVYRTYENDETILYEMTIKNMTGTKTKLDVDSYIYYADMKNKTILYEKEGTIYVKEHKKEKSKVISDFMYLPEIYSANSFYYIKSEEVTSKLIDLIDDDLATTDTEVTEPVYPDFPESPDYPVESDYEVQIWVDSSYGDEQNPETNEWGYWETSFDSDAYDKAYEEYESKYDEWDDEYTRLENEYYAAIDMYDAKLEREQLREELENEENAITYEQYYLHYVNNGTDTLVASNISTSFQFSSSDIPLVIYNKMSVTEKNKQKLSSLIEELGWYGVEDFISSIKDDTDSIQVVGSEVYVAYGEKEQVLDIESEVIYSYKADIDGNIYMLTDFNFDKEEGILMKVALKDEKLSKAVIVDEDVALMPYDFKNTNIYYFKNYKDGSGDMYLAGKLLAEDVYVHSLYAYEDGQLLYYKDYSNNKYRGTLTLYKNGKETKISDDASMYIPIDKNHIAFLFDYNNDRNKGDLMLYTGNAKPTLVDADVSYIFGSIY